MYTCVYRAFKITDMSIRTRLRLSNFVVRLRRGGNDVRTYTSYGRVRSTCMDKKRRHSECLIEYKRAVRVVSSDGWARVSGSGFSDGADFQWNTCRLFRPRGARAVRTKFGATVMARAYRLSERRSVCDFPGRPPCTQTAGQRNPIVTR